MKDLTEEYNHAKFELGDIFEPLRPLLQSGAYMMDTSTGKIRPRVQNMSDWDGPWIHTMHHPEADCNLWHKIMFNHFNFVPSGCMSCWKVVVRPRWLEDLFKLLELQIEIGKPSKCGTELRPTVFGVYGGYFYQRSKEEGQERYEQVVRGCEKYKINFLIGKDGPVKPLLKRGCTEMEHGIGPSDKWKQTPEQKMLEEILTKHVESNKFPQPKVNRVHIVSQWIKQAYSVGDPTVWQFNDNQPFYPSYVTYHKEVKDA